MLGLLPHGVSRADFFSRRKTFDYFFEIKEIKGRGAVIRSALRAFPST
jgi:hypothetical protein